MSIELTLFLLRIVSALTLFGILVVIFALIWQDYRKSVTRVNANRRSYGRLVSLQDIDGVLMDDGVVFPLLPLTTMGRSPRNVIVIEDSFASSDHATVTLRDGQWWLEDQQSRNGTMLNEKLITRPVVMTDGDVIGIGRRRFRLDLDRLSKHGHGL
jgi:hypothetical protein